MGEQSYFQRNFCAGRLKRTKAGRSPTPPVGDKLQVPSDPHDVTDPRPNSDRSTTSYTSNDTAEGLHEGEHSAQSRADSPSRRAPAEPTDAVPRESPPRQPSPPAFDRSALDEPSHDHIETLAFHPDAQSLEPSNSSEDTSKHKGKQSKLLKATKAILMFRRATSTSAHSSDRTANLRGSRSLVASFWSRQNTATLNEANGSGSAARVQSIDSFGLDGQQRHQHAAQGKPSNSRTHSTLSALFGGGGRQSGNSTEPAGGRHQQQASSSFSLPRFIVPRINALKLPIVCLIKSLDDELMREVFIHRYELGQYLMDNLNVSLGMRDEKYFGLKMANSLDEQEDVRRPWLDLNESVYKQVSKLASSHLFASHAEHDQHHYGPNVKSVSFYLRIKFYPPNLARVQDQFLKYYLWIQLRRDLRLGKLTSSQNNLTLLMACVLQYELADYSEPVISERLPQMSILPNQDLIEQQAVEIWREKLAGVQKHLALMQFLRASVILETYGFDYYPVRDHQRQRAFLLGFNYAGVKTIRNGRIANHFRWHNLSKISYERRMIIFHIYPNENSKRKQILGFKCLSNDDCQNLYLRLLEQKYFFTVDLAYFDKSTRRPSLLGDSTHNRPLELQQQQQSSARAGPESGQAQQAADYFGQILAGIEQAEADQADGQEAKTGDSELVHKRRFHYQHHGNQSSNNSTFDSSFECTQNSLVNPCPSHPLNGCNDSCSQNSLASSSCHQFPRRALPPPPPSLLAKSNSLQEPDPPCNSAACCAQLLASAPHQHDAIGSRRADSALPVGQANQAETQLKRAHHLERQCSFASYTPEPPQIEPQSAAASQRADQTDSRQRAGPTASNPNRERSIDPGGHFFWTSNQASGDGRVQRAGPNAEMLLQGLQLCLVMLVLNFFLRLSDGLCGFLVDLLSFRRHEIATATDNALGE